MTVKLLISGICDLIIASPLCRQVRACRAVVNVRQQERTYVGRMWQEDRNTSTSRHCWQK